MSAIYYLFLDLNSQELDTIFQTLKNVNEKGINFKVLNKHKFLPSYITINSIYRDNLFNDKIKQILRDINFNSHYEILKPLSKQLTFYPTSLEHFHF